MLRGSGRRFATKANGPTKDGSFAKGYDILEKFDGNEVAVRGFGETSFVINDILVNQSVLLLPHSVLKWSPRKFDDITIDSLSVVKFIYPTIEILFIGCGEKMNQPIPRPIVEHYRDKGVIIEASDSVNAAATFNILNAEGRNVAAALLTLEPYFHFLQ